MNRMYEGVSGEDIPRSIGANLRRMGVDIEVKRLALLPEQIQEMSLPGVPPKRTDTRTRNWSGGSVVELDAVEPTKLAEMCEEAIAEHFDEEKHEELMEKESKEEQIYIQSLKEFVESLSDKDEE